MRFKVQFENGKIHGPHSPRLSQPAMSAYVIDDADQHDIHPRFDLQSYESLLSEQRSSSLNVEDGVNVER